MARRSEWSSLVGGVDHLRLLLEHQHDRPAHGHDAQRLVGGVEDERLRHASSPAAGGRCIGPRGYRSTTSAAPTPVQVGDDVAGLGGAVGIAVRRSAAGTAGSRGRAAGAGASAATSRAARAGTTCRTAVAHSAGRTATATNARAQPPPAHRRPRPRHPTAAGADERAVGAEPGGHDARRRARTSSRARASSSAWAAAKNGSPKPSATEPPTTASRRSSRLATDATRPPDERARPGHDLRRWPRRRAGR